MGRLKDAVAAKAKGKPKASTPHTAAIDAQAATAKAIAKRDAEESKPPRVVKGEASTIEANPPAGKVRKGPQRLPAGREFHCRWTGEKWHIELDVPGFDPVVIESWVLFSGLAKADRFYRFRERKKSEALTPAASPDVV